MSATVQYIIVAILVGGAIAVALVKTVRLFRRKGSACGSCPSSCHCAEKNHKNCRQKH